MFKQKKFMAYLVTVFLLIVSMLIAACGGPSETKKDTAQSNKPIEITDVTGRTVTLKNQRRELFYNGVVLVVHSLRFLHLWARIRRRLLLAWIHLYRIIERICGSTLLQKCLS